MPLVFRRDVCPSCLEDTSDLPDCTPEANMCDSLGAVMSELAILGTYSVFLASSTVFALRKLPGMKIDRPGATIIGAVPPHE